MITNVNTNPVIQTSDKFYSLSKVIGMGTKDNYSISCNKKNGLTAWMTGPYIVFYDIKKDKQVDFLKNKNNKVFNCLSFSEEGSMLACGEGNCRSSEIIICEINFDSLKDSKVKASIKAHKYGVDKLKFFKNDKFLMSIGDRADKTMQVYSLANNNEVVFSAKYNRPILSFDICENFLVLGGNQFLKVWSFDDFDKKMVVSKHNVDMGKLKDKAFTSAVIYNGAEKRALLLTSDGHLAELKYSTKQICRWVHLKTEKGISLCIYDQMLVCGCGDGIIRIFKIETLEHFSTLHRPPPLGRANIDSNIKKINISTQTEKFADVVTLAYNPLYGKLISIYSDKTFFVWDLNKSEKIYVDCYNSFHSGSVNNMEVQVNSDNILAIATCSDDKTVRLWNFKLEDFGVEFAGLSYPVPRKIHHIAYSKIIRRIFYFSKNFTHFKFDMEGFIGGDSGVGNNNIGNKLNSESAFDNDDSEISAVKFTPDEKYLVCGDILGNLHIFNLSSFEKVNFASAHNAQISCIDFINTSSSQYLLATGSMDNLINVIDVSIGLEKDFENYERSVIDDHQAPVTNIIFLTDKLDQTKLVSCSADRSINFYIVHSASSTQLIQKFQEDDMNTYCLAFNPALKQVIAGHNGKATIWRTKKCVVDKIYQMKRGENLLDNFRIAVDQTGSIFATSNNDKYIRIRSVFDGQLITKIPIAESVSSLVFSIKNSYLIASSVEGYIYFFKIDFSQIPVQPPKPVVEKKKMKNKLNLLQKFMKEDINFSKNEKVQALIDKMKNSEDVKLEDLKLLDSYFLDKPDKPDKAVNAVNAVDEAEDGVEFANKIELLSKNIDTNAKEGKDVNMENANKDNVNPNEMIKSSNSEVIELKEEKANNEEEEEENKLEGENANANGKNVILNRSTIFEKNLKEVSAEVLKRSILNHTRLSLADTYQKKKDNKNEIHIPKSQVIESVFKKVAKKDEEKEKEKEPLKQNTETDTNSNSNINTNNTATAVINAPNIIPQSEDPHHKKSDSLSSNNTSNNSEQKSEPVNIKTNNFMNKNTPLTHSESQKVLMTHQSKKNLRDKEKENNTNSNDDLLNLQQLVSETCKKVDNIGNIVNSSSEIKKVNPGGVVGNFNTNSNKKEIKDEEFDYFSNDERLSMIKGIDLKEIPKANNIFKKNMHESETIDSTPSLSNKFSNVLKADDVVRKEKPANTNTLYEIAEDMHLEDEVSNLKINDATMQTHNFEVSDTMVNKDKFSMHDINANSNNNTFLAQSQSINLNSDTLLNDTTKTMINNLNTAKDSARDTSKDASKDTGKNTTAKETLHTPSLSNINSNNTRKNDCVAEKFCFSINSKEISNVSNMEKNMELLEKNIQIEDSTKLLHLLRLMNNLTEKIEVKLKESGHIKESEVEINKAEPTTKSETDLIMEKYIEKYSDLLMNKIEEKIKHFNK